LEATIAGYEREAKMEGSCRDDAIGHVGNNIAGNGSQDASDIVIERENFECGIVLAEFADNPLECIGGDAPSLDQVHHFNERYSRNIGWLATGCRAVNQRKDRL